MPKAPTKNGKVRLQFDFSIEASERMEEIRKRLDAGSKAEVMRRALRVLEFITSQEKVDVVLRDKQDGSEKTLIVI